MNSYGEHGSISKLHRPVLYFFQRAAKVASGRVDERNFWIGGCGIRQDGAEVFARNSPNKQRTPQIHAEAKIARKLGVGAVVYLVRLVFKDRGHRNNDKPREAQENVWGNARPCQKCENLLRSRGVSKIYYTIDNENYGVLEFKKLR